jgi:hypothetical protein
MFRFFPSLSKYDSIFFRFHVKAIKKGAFRIRNYIVRWLVRNIKLVLLKVTPLLLVNGQSMHAVVYGIREGYTVYLITLHFSHCSLVSRRLRLLLRRVAFATLP